MLVRPGTGDGLIGPRTSRRGTRDDGPVRGRTRGISALVGAGFFAVKSGGILATGEQVPYLFETAPACLGLCLLTLPAATGLPGPRASATVAIGGMVIAVTLAAVLADIVGELWGPGLGLAMFGVTAGALTAGWNPDDWTDRALLVAAVVPFPALAVGGALETVDERLLEIGLLLIAAAWAWVGVALLRERSR